MMAHDGNTSQMAATQPKFDDPQEEIAYLRQRLEESQREFQEFQESSQELETEFETQIQQLEKKNSESLSLISRLQAENDQLRTRYNAYTNDTQYKLNEYQEQIAELSSIRDRLSSYIRELEQSNDDLERARRTLAASLEDFEGKLNQQIERNVLLENEVSEKEELECTVQRLKEETRDLRHELIVNKNNADSSRRKLMMDNCLSVSQKDCSLPSIISNEVDKGEQTTVSRPNDISLNSLSMTSQMSDSQLTNNMSVEHRLPTVDSTTSPMTPQPTSRFTFSSPFSYGKSSSTSSTSQSTTTDSKSLQNSTPPSSPTLPSMVMTPSTRISALNIVNDLLRKVGALESKLASANKVTAQ